MDKQSIKQKRLFSDFQDIWDWVKELKEYKEDYKKQKKGTFKEKDGIKKWGFYPLADPYPPADPPKPEDGKILHLLEYVSNLTKHTLNLPGNVKLASPHSDILHFFRTEKGVFDPNNNKIGEKLRKPKKIVFEVHKFRDVDILGEEFKKILKVVYEIFNIKPERAPRYKKIDLYKIKTLFNLGYNRSRIETLMLSKHDIKDTDSPREESKRRLIRKYCKELGI